MKKSYIPTPTDFAYTYTDYNAGQSNWLNDDALKRVTDHVVQTFEDDLTLLGATPLRIPSRPGNANDNTD